MPSLLADIPDDSLGDLFREVTRWRSLALKAENRARWLMDPMVISACDLHAELAELQEDVRREIGSRRRPLQVPWNARPQWEDRRDSWLREAAHWLAGWDGDEVHWPSDGEELIRTARDLLAELP